MDPQRFFLSYSRHQLYFAEATAHTLQELGVDVWFDLQQLEPGTRWQDDIQHGLENCAGVILIVSRAALQSPYVAAEWMHALENGKPIYLVLFEPVDFLPVTVEMAGEMRTIPLDRLPADAAAIIDARRSFGASMRRLHDCLKGAAAHRDPLPAPNRWRIPTRMPLPIAYVAASMLALTLLSLYITLTLLIDFIPMAIVGAITTAYLAQQTWLFVRRESYSGTRICLVIAPFLVALFAFRFLPFAVIALALALYSPDVHRWSPMAQGRKRRYRVQRATHRHGQALVTALIFTSLGAAIDPLLALPFILVMAFIARRRQRFVQFFDPTTTGAIAFRIHAAPQDASIAEDVRGAMLYAGHRPIGHYDKTTPDYHLVIISHYAAPPPVQKLESEGGKIIVIVASSFPPSPIITDYQRYQWLDYRRQDPERLVAMALDIRRGHEINSFSTHIVPQDFQRVLVPRRVFLFTAVSLVFYNLTIAQLARALAVGQDVSVLGVIYVAASLMIAAGVLQRVMLRTITVTTIALINVALAFGSNLIFFISALMFTPPAGYTRSSGNLPQWAAINAVAIVAGYFIARYQLNTILQWWLPPADAFASRTSDLRAPALLRAIAVSGAVVALVTVGFFGAEVAAAQPDVPPQDVVYHTVEVDGGLRLDVPSHWPRAYYSDNMDPYVRNVPIAAIIRQADGPVNDTIATTINMYFQSGLFGSSLVVSSLVALGESVEQVFDTIIWSLSSRNARWRPTYYGAPVFSTATSDGERAVVASVWAFTNPYNMRGLGLNRVISDLGEAGNVEVRSFSFSTAFADHPFALVNNTAFYYADDPETLHIALTLDTQAQDYFVIIKGPPELIAAASPLLEQLIASARFENAPEIVRTPTPTPSPYLSPTPSQTPTITLTPSLTWTPTITLTPSPTFTPSPTPPLDLAVYGENRGRIAIGGGQRWEIDGRQGDILTIEVRADRPANDGTSRTFDPNGLDTLVIVRDPDGNIIAENDDAVPNEVSLHTDSRIDNLILPVTGIYQIEVRSWNDQTGGAYTLIVTPGTAATPTP